MYYLYIIHVKLIMIAYQTGGAKIRSAVQHSMENRKAVNFYRYIYIAYISKI